jgi:16S rRNA (guanine(966)-N(2))-methyltransferase RsmD
MLREALFSILGNAVPGRPFFDVFGGTGAVGLEALSRGASSVVFVERDFRVAGEIEHHLKEFGVAEQGTVLRADAYPWLERWTPPDEPVNVFLGPPYPDWQRRLDDLLTRVAELQRKLAAGSVLIVQAEKLSPDQLPEWNQWDVRSYGRNQLLIWVKES